MKNYFLRDIRQRIEYLNRLGQLGEFIKYEVMPDEVNDLTLISFRVYGSREWADVIKIAVGANTIFEEAQTKTIVLPTLNFVLSKAREHGVL